MEFNQRATDRVDYAKLTRIIQQNEELLSVIAKHSGLKKEEVIGAAILHFSTLPLKEQFKVVAEYLKKG
jgi:hypothetical protein